MSFRLPRIYPLTDVQLTGLSHAEQVRRLASGGAEVIQLREKTLNGREFFEAARAALAVARAKAVKLIINDRVDMALAVGADGVHLGQDDLSPAEARKILGAGAIIGFSTHTLSQAIEGLKLPIDYLAIGPVFSTTTKSDTAPMVGLEGVADVRKQIGNLHLVAIGGINGDNAEAVFRAGADSVALINALLSHPPSISQRIASLIKRF